MAVENQVRQCVCYPYTFLELKILARENGWKQVEDITRAVGCGGGCGLCRPYLALMLKTGETAFEVVEAL